MQISLIVLILLIESLLIALLAAGGLFLYVQRLRRQLKELAANSAPKSEPQSVDSSGEQGALLAAAPAKKAPSKTYTQYIDQQIFAVRAYHQNLEGAQDLALDVDPSAPLERRIAAVRNAVLIAEREATLDGEVNWTALKNRYKAILSYYEDYPSPKAEARIHELTEALNAARQNLQGLEKYKSLFFDVEAKWHASQSQADDYYNQIRDKVALTESSDSDKEHLISLVSDYRSSYSSVTEVFDNHTPLPTTIEAASEELRALRRTTAEQHRLIDHLKQQINKAGTDNEKVALIRELEEELNRQQRFIRESESCVQLMEDELSAAHKELNSLKQKLKELPNLRAQLKELHDDAGVHEVMVNRLKDEVRKLKDELATVHLKNNQVAGDAAPASAGGVDEAMAAELSQLKKQYADLEERYLDLKLESQ